jgi:hypothetical protein
MSFVTAAEHCITELEFVSADDVLNIVTFRALSKSGATGAYNYASLDVVTGETHCSCKGAETHRECWHMTLLQAAFEALPAVALARQYTTEQLVKAGTKAARMCRVYRRRAWRVLPADAVALVACRAEYRRRMGLVAVAAPVAA